MASVTALADKTEKKKLSDYLEELQAMDAQLAEFRKAGNGDRRAISKLTGVSPDKASFADSAGALRGKRIQLERQRQQLQARASAFSQSLQSKQAAKAAASFTNLPVADQETIRQIKENPEGARQALAKMEQDLMSELQSGVDGQKAIRLGVELRAYAAAMDAALHGEGTYITGLDDENVNAENPQAASGQPGRTERLASKLVNSVLPAHLTSLNPGLIESLAPQGPAISAVPTEGEEQAAVGLADSMRGGAPMPQSIDRRGVQGLLEPGNIDLANRPQIRNPDGSISTVRSMSFRETETGPEILIPTVSNDRLLSAQEAIEQYRRTGQHLGKFSDPDSATAYSQQLHEDQASGNFVDRTQGFGDRLRQMAPGGGPVSVREGTLLNSGQGPMTAPPGQQLVFRNAAGGGLEAGTVPIGTPGDQQFDTAFRPNAELTQRIQAPTIDQAAPGSQPAQETGPVAAAPPPPTDNVRRLAETGSIVSNPETLELPSFARNMGEEIGRRATQATTLPLRAMGSALAPLAPLGRGLAAGVLGSLGGGGAPAQGALPPEVQARVEAQGQATQAPPLPAQTPAQAAQPTNQGPLPNDPLAIKVQLGLQAGLTPAELAQELQTKGIDPTVYGLPRIG